LTVLDKKERIETGMEYKIEEFTTDQYSKREEKRSGRITLRRSNENRDARDQTPIRDR
jgi:hypothetical protein